MADNISVIKDPTIYLKPGQKLVEYLTRNLSDCKKNEKDKVPKNIQNLLKNSNSINLENSDINWLNEYLVSQRKLTMDDLLSGKELDNEIEGLVKENFANIDAIGLLEEKNKGLPYLHVLMTGSSLILPQNEIIERNSVLAERIEKLKKMQEEKEYQAMIQNVNTSKKYYSEDSISYQMNMMNRHLIAVGQLLVSIGAGFAFGFLGLELMIGDIHFGVRLLLGISFALIIGLAEFYFLAKSLNAEETREEESTVKKAKNKEPVSLSKFRPKANQKSKVHKD